MRRVADQAISIGLIGDMRLMAFEAGGPDAMFVCMTPQASNFLAVVLAGMGNHLIALIAVTY